MKSLCSALFGAALLGAFVLQFPSGACAQARERTVYSFCSKTGCADGAESYASLIDVHGTLYGTTYEGGSHNSGAVFSFDPGTGAETVLYSFCSQTKCADGANPYASLINVNGTLYGTTYQGGVDTGECVPAGCGTVFSLDPATGAETVLYSFCSNGCSDGASPYAGLIDVNGKLYGTTYAGGAGYNGGTAFSLDPSTGKQKVLHSFCTQSGCTDGGNPRAGLISVNGMLYGTTYEGGSHDAGTVFSLDPGTGVYAILYSFCSQGNCADGELPYAGLIDVNGKLYGTTKWGGGTGGLFSVDPGTGAETVVYPFCSLANCADGANPVAGLIDVNGTLYGTTLTGGAGKNAAGTVFSFDPGTGTETVLYSFCGHKGCRDGEDGKSPAAGAIKSNGRLYGTTFAGGANGSGIIFRVKGP